MTCTIHAKFWQDTKNVDIKNENGTKKKKTFFIKKKISQFHENRNFLAIFKSF